MASTGPPSGGLVALAANQKLYHLTSKRDFKLDPRKAPQNNTTLGGDFGPGIYLGPSVEYWCNGYGYWRPWVVEIVAPADIRDREGTLGGYGSEVFVPAKYYNELQIVRVIPLDAWCREEYGTYGWTEGYFETTFDTNEPIVLPPSERLPGPYRYPGDARNADATWASEYAKRVKRFARTRTNAIASKTSAGTDPTSGAFQDRLGRCYEIAGRYARENKGSFLVHGSIGHPWSRLKREPDQPPIGHAWAVDADGEVFEPISGKHFSWDAYRDLFGAVEWIRYPSDDVPLLMLKHRNWGPWDAEYIEADNIWRSNFMRWKDRQKTSAVASANDVFYHGDSTAAPYGVGDTLTHSEKHEVWFTNNLRDARAYANRAVKRIGGEPIVYEVEVLSSTQRPPFKNPSGVQYCVGDVVLRGVVDTVATWSQTVASVRQGQGIPYLISEEDGVRVGDLEYYLDDDEEWGPIVKILNITVEPDYQHQGVARQMVQALERLFPDRYVAHGGFHSTAGESFAWSFKGNPRHLIENRDGDLRRLAVTAKRQVFFHGSPFALPVGTILTPGGPGGSTPQFDYTDDYDSIADPTYLAPAEYRGFVWMTDTIEKAESWAGTGRTKTRHSFVYLVEPLGGVRASGPYEGRFFLTDRARVVARVGDDTYQDILDTSETPGAGGVQTWGSNLQVRMQSQRMHNEVLDTLPTAR